MKKLTTPDIAVNRFHASKDLTGRATDPALADELCSETVDYNSAPIDDVVFVYVVFVGVSNLVIYFAVFLQQFGGTMLTLVHRSLSVAVVIDCGRCSMSGISF
jgi:hypothetical protein